MKAILKTLFLLILFIPCPGFTRSYHSDFKPYFENLWKISKSQKRYLFEHKVLADAEVESKKGKQSFSLKAMALHKKKCRKALRKLSRLEEYHEWIDFIKESKYSDKSHLFSLLADHPLLPWPMRIHILVERPTKEGKYPFTFPTGMFRGLTGFFQIQEIEKKCFFYAESNWHGKKTRVPNLIIEIFSETLSKIGGEILMRKSQ